MRIYYGVELSWIELSFGFEAMMQHSVCFESQKKATSYRNIL